MTSRIVASRRLTILRSLADHGPHAILDPALLTEAYALKRLGYVSNAHPEHSPVVWWDITAEGRRRLAPMTDDAPGLVANVDLIERLEQFSASPAGRAAFADIAPAVGADMPPVAADGVAAWPEPLGDLEAVQEAYEAIRRAFGAINGLRHGGDARGRVLAESQRHLAAAARELRRVVDVESDAAAK